MADGAARRTATAALLALAALLGACAPTSKDLASAPSGSSSPEVSDDTIWSVADYQPMRVAMPETGAQIGEGWDYLLGRGIPNKCVTGKLAPIDNAEAATLEYHYVFDRATLDKLMSLSISASYNGMAAGGSVYANFSSEKHIDNSHTYILASVLVDRGGQQLTGDAGDGTASPFTLTDYAKGLLSSDTSGQAFFKACGDGFVAATRNGGRLYELFDATSKADIEDSKMALGASFHAYGASGKVDFSEDQKTGLYSNADNRQELEVGGDQIEGTGPTSAEKVANKIMLFAASKPETWRMTDVVVLPYRSVPGFPTKTFQRIAPSRLREYLDQLHRVQDLYALYEDAAIHPTAYYTPFMSRQMVSDTANMLGLAAAELDATLAACETSATCDPVKMREQALTESQNGSVALFKPVGKGQSLGPDRVYPLVARQSAPLLLKTALTRARTDDKNDYYSDPQAIALWAGLTGLTGQGKTEAENAAWRVMNPKGPEPPAAFPATNSAMSYYLLLAMAPMPKADSIDRVKAYCGAFSLGGCDSIAAGALSATSPAPDAQRIFANWVLAERLAPLQQSHCQTSAQDLMCVPFVALSGLIKTDSPVFGPDRGFEVPAAQPAPPPVVINPPVDPCPHHWNGACGLQ